MANIQSMQSLRVNDPVITNIVHGYAQADSIAPFIAPSVPVAVRAGKVVKFGKEQFAVLDTRRAPGSTIQRLSTGFTTEGFYLEQYALASEVPEEAYQEAMNGEARLDLRMASSLRTASNVMLSWERDVIQKVTTASAYESTCTTTLLGTSKFSNSASDPEQTIQVWKEAVRAQIGCYPNSAVISTDVYNALKFHPIFRDRVKYTSSASINLDMLAQWFDLPRGIRIAQKVTFDTVTGRLTDIMPAGTVLLFFSPEVGIGDGFLPIEGADKAVPSFAYTYMLDGYPIATPERFDDNRRVYVTDLIIEQVLQMTGIGATGKVGAGFLANGVV